MIFYLTRSSEETHKTRFIGVAVALLSVLALFYSSAASAQLATGLEGASGSAVGPDGALYVTEGLVGRITRIDPQSGEKTTFTEGLPPSQIGIGGVIDVTFSGGVAYALVTVVEPIPALGVETGTGASGIYRVDGPASQTLIADLGQWSIDNPSASEVFVLTGVQYAMQNYQGGFLITDGHHNRILFVSKTGRISGFAEFGNVVPTGLEIKNKKVFVTLTGPAPHNPEDAKLLVLKPNNTSGREVAAGGLIELNNGGEASVSMFVDVEYGPCKKLYVLAQGIWDGAFPGSPAMENTGSLVRIGGGGKLQVIETGLDRPTSMEIIGKRVYVVTLDGEVWLIPLHDKPGSCKPS